MTLNKLIDYLEKNNIKELTRADRFNGFCGVRYRREQWGYNYFNNINLTREGLFLEFNYTSDAGNVAELKKAERLIKKYAARYNYSVFWEGHNLTGFWFAIMPADDKKQIDIISYFVDESIKECDILIHNYHVCGIYDTLHKQLNNELYNIMSRWEQAYLDYIKDHKQENTNNNIILFVA